MDFDVLCPCCNARLKVDADLKAVVAHEAPKVPRKFASVDDALGALKGADEEREKKFAASIEAEKSKKDVLNRKFQELFEKTKDDSSPAVMRPASTSWLPIHSTTTMAPNTSATTMAPRLARARAPAAAAENACSVAAAKRSVSRPSWAKDCTVRTAFSVSSATADASPTRSWVARDRRRT